MRIIIIRHGGYHNIGKIKKIFMFRKLVSDSLKYIISVPIFDGFHRCSHTIVLDSYSEHIDTKYTSFIKNITNSKCYLIKES